MLFVVINNDDALCLIRGQQLSDHLDTKQREPEVIKMALIKITAVYDRLVHYYPSLEIQLVVH